MRFIILTAFLMVLAAFKGSVQGCVARCNTSSRIVSEDAATDKWLLNINTRYYKSFSHFAGTAEQKHRIDDGIEVFLS